MCPVGRNRARREPCEAFRSSQVFGDGLELIDGRTRFPAGWPHRSVQAVVKMVVNERLLRLADGAFDGMQLLRQIDAGAAFLDHGNDLLQVASGAAQALEDVRVRLVTGVAHSDIVSPWIGYVSKKAATAKTRMFVLTNRGAPSAPQMLGQQSFSASRILHRAREAFVHEGHRLRAFHVARRHLLDAEPGVFDELTNRPIQMAAPADSLPERCKGSLP